MLNFRTHLKISVVTSSALQHAMLGGFVFGVYHAFFFYYEMRFHAQNIAYHLRQIVAHERFVHRPADFFGHLRMVLGISGREVDEERNVELRMHCLGVVGRQVGAAILIAEIVYFFSVVGQIEHHGIAVLKHADDAVHHIVVV